MAESAVKLQVESLHRCRPGKAKDADAPQGALARLRLHDLRHAACSMWLNAPGVDGKVGREWSGHKRLSVFLDIYQRHTPGAKTSAAAKLNAAWQQTSGRDH
jgi:integrase